MNRSRIIFFPDPLNDDTSLLLKNLKLDNMCYVSSNTDEFDQVFKQSGRFVILFSSVAFSTKFLNKNSDFLSKLKFKCFCFLGDKEVLTKENQDFLKTHLVTLFQKNKSAEIEKNINLYFEELIFET